MRIELLIGAALLAATSAKADVITQIGRPVGPTRSENFASIIYQFAPVTIPGTITAITATYVGFVVPGDYITGLNTVSDITLTPFAQIDNTSGPIAGIGYSNFFVPPPTTAVAGAPQTISAARFGAGFVTGVIGSPITVSTTVAVFPDNVTALASGPILLAVDGYTQITGETYIPGSIGNLQVGFDASTVNAGRFTLSITYSPSTDIPEPMSLTLLGVGLLGLVVLRRSA